ncbi:hypothetical protein E4U43_004938 [Claviceps pusilla]|uniref:Uncharacterized protein n=1 Tax=Claviceps pusilla TaxID=123648 RepID=A0A9P7SZ55_9HYPO|nr:hypothetical protein E4U43_004938 [Claviceps pusilla]
MAPLHMMAGKVHQQQPPGTGELQQGQGQGLDCIDSNSIAWESRILESMAEYQGKVGRYMWIYPVLEVEAIWWLVVFAATFQVIRES